MPAAVSSASPWVPAATLAAAIIAALVASVSAWLQRKSGRESADAARRSAEASDRSARAAEASVAVNERTSVAVSRRAEADALSKRYQDAAELLGHERAAVRHAGVYAMARLADDWPEQRQSCLDVLCGYLKMAPINEPSEPEVRMAIAAMIADHLRPEAGEVSWSPLRIDLSNAHLEEVDFTDAVFLRRTRFTNAYFARTCILDRVTFVKGAEFDHARLEDGGLLRLENCNLGEKSTFRRFIIEQEANLIIFQDVGHRVDACEMQVMGTLYIRLNSVKEGEYYDLTATEVEDGAILRVDFSRGNNGWPTSRRVSTSVHVADGGEVRIPQILIDTGVVHWGPFSSASPDSLTFTPDPMLQEKLRNRLHDQTANEPSSD